MIVEAAFEDRYVDLVAESFDVAIRIGTLTDSRLVARRLAPSRRMLCAAPAYLQARAAGRPSRPIWLAMPAWAFSAWPRIRFGICARTTRSRPFASAARWSPTMHSLVQAAVAGAGIAMVSDWPAELCSGKLVPVLPEHPVQDSEAIYLVHPSARLVPAKTRAYADWISAALGQAVAASWIHAAMTYCRQAPMST